MNHPCLNIRNHILAVFGGLDIRGFDREVAGGGTIGDRSRIGYDTGAVVGGLDIEAIRALGHRLTGLIREIPNKSLDAALGGRGARKGIDLLVRERLGSDMLHPGRRTGCTVGITAGWLGAVAAAPLGGKLRNIEGLYDLPVDILDPDGILVGPGAGLLVILKRQLQAARL